MEESAAMIHENNCQEDTIDSKALAIPALLLPLASPSQLKLLQFALANRPLSKAILFGLNSILVNRDGGLFDNLPWDLWSVDPQKRNYDAAGNPIDARFHLGKRDAYNRFMGKDWQGRSASIGNMALRLKFMMEMSDDKQSQPAEAQSDSQESNDDLSSKQLAQRILEVQIRELEMDVAEWEYQLAVARTSNPNQESSCDEQLQACQDELLDTKIKLQALLDEDNASNSSGGKYSSIVGSILQEVADWTTGEGKNQAPYRGANGYSPKLDTKVDIEESILPYTSPYDFMREILDDQLNCEIIGSVLENTSLLKGTLALGGALVLRRKTATKRIVLAGEEIEINDEDEALGNVGGKGGKTMLVECDADEAIGMAITCNAPIYLEPGTWEQSNSLVVPILSLLKEKNEKPNKSVRNALSPWKTLDSELSVLVEGQAENETTTKRSLPLRIPRTTTSLFDSIFEPTSLDAPSGMFPTDNPIQSLNEYDELDDAGKARTLLSMSNFKGKLPRPRVLRKEKVSGTFANSLDNLLLPLIDETARRQYLMRDAELRGDTERLEELRNEKTRRQMAKEMAEEARMRGEDDVAEWWETEAKLYGDLRADVTQDEGAYSRFLDRDEWYERGRQLQAKKLNRKKFGTLLDGIE